MLTLDIVDRKGTNETVNDTVNMILFNGITIYSIF